MQPASDHMGCGPGVGEKGKEKAVMSNNEDDLFGPDPADAALFDEATDASEISHLFALDHCRKHGHKYAFQIAQAEVGRYSIRIESGKKPDCSCHQGEISCCHVEWLLQQISRTRFVELLSLPASPHHHISVIGLPQVCESLRWELREEYEWEECESEHEEEDTHWELKKDHSRLDHRRRPKSMILKRMKMVRQIMATFSHLVPDDYRRDIFETTRGANWEESIVLGDLEATVSRLLILDDDLFDKFRSLVSHDACASDYFRKMKIKARQTCSLLDEYCENGPAAGQHHIVWCAETLVQIVNSISLNVKERQPLSSVSREEAAKALVFILKMVVNERNHDVYQNLKWNRRRPYGERQIDRNLYQRLIGSMSSANPSGGNFVIKTLKDLPEARVCIEDLEEIISNLETIGWGPAPQTYRDSLSGFVTQLRGKSRPRFSSRSTPVLGLRRRSLSGKRRTTSVDQMANKRIK